MFAGINLNIFLPNCLSFISCICLLQKKNWILYYCWQYSLHCHISQWGLQPFWEIKTFISFTSYCWGGKRLLKQNQAEFLCMDWVTFFLSKRSCSSLWKCFSRSNRILSASSRRRASSSFYVRGKRKRSED